MRWARMLEYLGFAILTSLQYVTYSEVPNKRNAKHHNVLESILKENLIFPRLPLMIHLCFLCIKSVKVSPLKILKD